MAIILVRDESIASMSRVLLSRRAADLQKHVPTSPATH